MSTDPIALDIRIILAHIAEIDVGDIFRGRHIVAFLAVTPLLHVLLQRTWEAIFTFADLEDTLSHYLCAEAVRAHTSALPTPHWSRSESFCSRIAL
jgi:hypothetical protein